MFAVKPNLLYALDSFRPLYFLFRLLPCALNLISRKALPLALLSFFMAILFVSPNPNIDVYCSNSLGVDFLFHGLNPYSQTYPDIYDGQFDYHPGFLYWPGSLYLQAVSKLIFGDIRAVLILAWWGAAFFFPKANPLSQSLQKLWWFIPFIPFGMEQGWLDPLLSFAAALTLWSMKNKRWWWLAIAIAMAASAKQYGFIVGAFPLAMLALDREWHVFVKVSLTSFIIFLLALAPSLLWDFHGFLAMTVTTQISSQTRPDALNFTAFWMRATGSPFPSVAQLVMTIYGFGLALFHLRKNRDHSRLSVIAECWAIAFGFSMMFGKFAFCNYYWLLISFLILTLAFEQDVASSKEMSPEKKASAHSLPRNS